MSFFARTIIALHFFLYRTNNTFNELYIKLHLIQIDINCCFWYPKNFRGRVKLVLLFVGPFTLFIIVCHCCWTSSPLNAWACFFLSFIIPYLILQRNNDSLKKNECIEMNTITLRRTKFLLCKPIKHKFPITYITMMYTSGLTFFAKKKQYWHWIYIWEQKKHLVGIFWAAFEWWKRCVK